MSPLTQPEAVPYRNWTDHEHETWSYMYGRLEQCRAEMAVPEFDVGLKALGITGERIPDIDAVNKKLYDITGWKAQPVKGLESPTSFYPMLANKTFPIGNFIRDREDVSYTPAPDIFHDLYGHMAFFIDPTYASFCEKVGKLVVKYVDKPVTVRQIERLFWFTIEFALIDLPQGRRIFGGGILSSKGESEYALSDKPTVKLFEPEVVRQTEFDIDSFQELLFLLPDRESLFGCLEAYEAGFPDA